MLQIETCEGQSGITLVKPSRRALEPSCPGE